MKKNYILFYYYLKEIRYRIATSFICFFSTFFVTYLYNFEFLYLIIQPFSRIFIFTEMSEMVEITLKISLWLALFCSLPYTIYGYFCFISPSLYRWEQKAYLRKFIFLHLLSYGQTVIAFIMIPFVFQFFAAFEIKSLIYTIAWEIRIDSYFRFLQSYFFTFYLLLLVFYISLWLPFNFPRPASLPKCYGCFAEEESAKKKRIKISATDNGRLYTSYSGAIFGTYILKKKNKKKVLFFFIILGSFISPSDFFTQLFITSCFYFSFLIYFFIIFILHKYKLANE